MVGADILNNRREAGENVVILGVGLVGRKTTIMKGVATMDDLAYTIKLRPSGGA